MSSDVTQTEAWECFQDSSYYDMWCVRQVGDRTFGSGFHLMRGEEATALRDLLNQRADAQVEPVAAQDVAALVSALEEALNAPMIDHSGEGRGVYDILRTALAKHERNGQ